MDKKNTFDRAVSAAKENDFQTARQITRELLKKYQNDIDALLLYSHVAENESHAIAAIKRILEIDPDHKIARQKLVSLQVKPPEPAPSPIASPASIPTPQIAFPAAPSSEKAIPPDKNKAIPEKKKKRRSWVEPVLLGVLVCAILCFAFAILGDLSNKGILPQMATSVPTPTENEIYAVLYENIDAMNDRSISRYMATVHPESAVYEMTEEALRESFATFQLRSSIGELEILKRTSSTVEISFVLTTRKVSGPAFRDNMVSGVMTLKKDGDVWKIYKQKTDDVQYLD